MSVDIKESKAIKFLVKYIVGILFASFIYLILGFIMSILDPNHTTADFAVSLAFTALLYNIISESKLKDLLNKKSEL